MAGRALGGSHVMQLIGAFVDIGGRCKPPRREARRGPRSGRKFGGPDPPPWAVKLVWSLPDKKTGKPLESGIALLLEHDKVSIGSLTKLAAIGAEVGPNPQKGTLDSTSLNPKSKLMLLPGEMTLKLVGCGLE